MAEIKKLSTELQVKDKLLDTSGDAGTSGQILSSTGTGTNWINSTAFTGGTVANATTFSTTATFNGDIIANTHVYGRSVDAESSKLYRFGGLYLTWDSDSYGLNNHHSLRSTYGNSFTDSITLNSYNHIRFNIDSNNNNSTSYFEVGDGVTDTSNVIFRLDQAGDVTITGDITVSGGDIVLGGDVNLYRDGANILRTDDAFHANGHIHVGGASGGGNIYNRSDTSNYIAFSSNAITFSKNATFTGTVTWSGGSSTNANTAYGWGNHASAGYLTSSSTQSKYLRSDASDTGTGTITLADSSTADNPLILGSSSQTSYTLQQWQTSAHGTNEAYIIAYGAGHGSQAGNFAMKNIESGGEIFFELAAGVEPLRMTSTGSTFAGSIRTTADIGRDDHNRIMFSTDNSLIFRVADTHRFRMDSNNFSPYADSSYDLGTSSLYFRHGYIDAITTTGDVTVGGDITVAGNLNITGDINSVSVTDLDVTDKTITVGVGQTAANSGSSGILISRSDSTDPSMLWNQSTSRFDFNSGLTVTGQIHTTGSVYAKGSLFVIDTNGTNNHIQARSNGTEGFLTVSNGSNWGFIVRGPSNDPRIGAWYGGTLKIEGFHSSDGATGSNAIDFVQFQFGNDHFQMNAATSTFAGGVTINSNSFSLNGTAPTMTVNSSNNASGFRINVTGLDANGDDLFRAQDSGTTRFTIKRNGDANFLGDVTMTQTSGNNILYINSSGGGAPVIYFEDSNRKWGQFVSNGHLYFKDETANVTSLKIDGATALATFAGVINTVDGNATTPAYNFTSHDGNGMYLEEYDASNNKEQVSIATDGVRRFRANEAGIWSDQNVYFTGSLRKFGAWQATSGTAGEGFSFQNTADSTTPLSLTSAGNATFAGTVSATRGTFSNAIGTFPLITSTPYDYVAKFESTDAGAYIIIEDSSSTNNANRVGVAGNTMYLQTNATTALTLDGSQNATFAGDVIIGDNKKLHGGRVHPRSVYSTANTNGFLIATDVASNAYAMIQGEIDLIQFNSSTKQRIEFSATLNNNGTVFNSKGTADIDITIKLFVYNSKWYVHVPQATTYMTCTAYISKANAYVGDDDANNSITNLTSATVPGSGVTGSTDIVCKFSQGNVTFAGDVIVPEYIKHGGDLDTSIRFTTNQIRLYTANSVGLTLDSSQNATFAGAVKAYGNSDTAPAFEMYSDSNHGMRILHRGTEGDFSFERRLNGTNTEFLRIGRANGNATFAGDVDSQGYTINESTLQGFHDFQSRPIDADSGMFTVGGHGMAIGYSRAISLWSTTNGVWRSWIGTNLRWDGTNYKRASNHGNNNWGNIAGILFTGNNAATGAAMSFIIDPPENASGSGEATIGTSLPSGYTALTINNDLSATFAGEIKQSTRTTLHDNGTITWGSSNNFGELSWDGDYALYRGRSGKGIKLQTNGSTTAMQIDSSQNVKVVAGQLQISGDNANFATLEEHHDGAFDIRAVSDFTIDAAGDIILDAGGGDITLKDDSTQFARFTKSGDDFHIVATRSDGDIKFFGSDGGSSVTALTLDMSSAGTATFNNELYIPNYIYHVSDANTYFGFNSSDQWKVAAGGNVGIQLQNTGVYLYYGGNEKLRTISTGISVTGDIADRDIPCIINTGWGDDSSTTSSILVPLGNTVDDVSIGAKDGEHTFVAPYAGKIVKIIMKNTNGTLSSSFTTELKYYKNGSSAATSGELTASSSAITWSPTSSNTFAAGDEINILYQKSAGSKYWREVSMTIVIELTDYDI